jgi:hypothetical protein
MSSRPCSGEAPIIFKTVIVRVSASLGGSGIGLSSPLWESILCYAALHFRDNGDSSRTVTRSCEVPALAVNGVMDRG